MSITRNPCKANHWNLLHSYIVVNSLVRTPPCIPRSLLSAEHLLSFAVQAPALQMCLIIYPILKL